MAGALKNSSPRKTSRIARITAFSSIASIVLVVLIVVVLTAWAFSAHLHPDRVGDFASFLQLCVSVIIPK